MSSPAALATVTATLQHLLSGVAQGGLVSTLPPSAARSNGNTGDQLNIFLYGLHYNPAFSNAPMPGETRNGESAYPPMALILKYLITAYGASDDDISGQQLMGQAMRLLHDHPLLSRADIEGIVPDSNLHEQIERIRITPDTLSLDDMSKLWTSFQSAEYRLSMGYEVSVVLIESSRAGRAPLPVLKRGETDRGADVAAAPSPSLLGFRFPNQKPSAEMGDTITLLGEHLNMPNIAVRLRHPRLSDPITLQPLPDSTETELLLSLPSVDDDPELGSKWPAGFYATSLVISPPETPAWSNSSVPLPFSPNIVTIDPTSAPAGQVVLTVECWPQIKEKQQVALVFGERLIPSDPFTTPADPTAASVLTFTIDDAVARTAPYVIRLRVDGVDSNPVDFTGATPEFADNQKVTIT